MSVFWLAAISIEPGRAEDIHLETLTIPAVIAGVRGPVSANLEVIVLRPDDSAPHPLAVLNHGSPRDGGDRPNMSAYGLSSQAMAFARRGWVAVAFLRRGYGHSQGIWAENYGSCSSPDYAAAGRAGAADIIAVAKFMATQSYVSKDKWISVGVSAGGFATVALTSEAPPDLAAAIAFAPGRGSTSPDSVCGAPQLVSAFSQFGQMSRVPLLWVSAPNDHFFGPALVQQFTGAFSKAGGNLTFVQSPAFGTDGHQLFSAGGLPIWSPIVDRFLMAHHLTFRDHLIDVSMPNAVAPSSLNAGGRDAFKTYLESGPNKAFAVSSDSHFGWATGRRSPDDARRDALGFCTKNAPASCRVVNVNNKPVE